MLSGVTASWKWNHRCTFARATSFSQIKIQRRTHCIVLLPEVPNVSATNNELLRVIEHKTLPWFSNLNTIENGEATAKLALEFEAWLQNHCDSPQVKAILDAGGDKSFHTVLEPIEKESADVDYAWSTTRQFNNITEANLTPESRAWKEMRDVGSTVVRSRYQRFSNVALYNAVKELDPARLTLWQRSLVHKHLLEGRLNGLELSEERRDILVAHRSKLEELKRDYLMNVFYDDRDFGGGGGGLSVYNVKELDESPEYFLRMIANDVGKPYEGPWTIRPQAQIYKLFMRYCSSSERRFAVFREYNKRAGFEYDPNYKTYIHNNSAKIEDIRGYRALEAAELGFKSFAEMSMQTKMAGSVANVQTFISSIKPKVTKKFKEQYADIERVATEDQLRTPLKSYDVDYYVFREAALKYEVPCHGELAQYFPLSVVWDNLLKVAKNWFDVEFEEITSDINTWDPCVRAFKAHSKTVTSSQPQLSYLLVDPFYRTEKPQRNFVEAGRSRSDVVHHDPIAYLNFSFWCPPEKEAAWSSCLLELDEVKDLYREFGKALQLLLAEAPYPDIAGLNNVDWDAVGFRGAVLEQLLYRPEFLVSISRHYENNDRLSLDVAERIIKCQKRVSVHELLRNLYLSELDITLYTASIDKFWFKIMKALWSEYFPYEREKDDYHPCSFTPIITHGLAAAYYSRLWSDMLASDVVDSIVKDGLDTDKPNDAAKRYRNSFLAYGGGAPQIELFRQCCSREPSVDPFLEFHGLPQEVTNIRFTFPQSNVLQTDSLQDKPIRQTQQRLTAASAT